MNIGERPKAYSYVRFSTPEQAKGRSYERQIEAAQAYARENGLELAETTYKDLGVSAFRGANAQTGALRVFLKAVEEGDISSGSYLLVESLDRLTRSSILEAQSLFGLIIGAGITLVTLMDKRSYSRESVTASPTDLIISIVIMMRGHEESTTKARRVADAYERKRKDAGAGNTAKPFTRMLPAWLTWDDTTSKHAVLPKRATVIKNIFGKADEGWGQHRIAQWLNERGTETWGGRGKQRKAEHWHRSYVKKILTNSAVVGTFTPHQRTTEASGKRKRKPLDPIENYWPAVVDRELFERVTSHARAVAPRGSSSERAPISIFAGLLKCSHCEGSVVRVSKGAHVYLVCSRANAKAKGCKYQAVRYGDVEAAMRSNARAIFKAAPRGRGTGELEREIEALDDAASVVADQARELTDELVREKSAVVRQRLREKEAELDETRDKLRTLKVNRDALGGPYVLRRLTALRDALRHKPINVVTTNKALKEVASKIIFDPEAARLTIHWHHSDEITADIPFVSRHTTAFDAPNESVRKRTQ